MSHVGTPQMNARQAATLVASGRAIRKKLLRISPRHENLLDNAAALTGVPVRHGLRDHLCDPSVIR
eukprot:4762912-Pleurochrysis_carterae.AAC.1